MVREVNLSNKQFSIRLQALMGIPLCCLFVLVGLCCIRPPEFETKTVTTGMRLGYTLRCQIFPYLLLNAIVIVVARQRFRNEKLIDPTNETSNDTLFQTNSRVLVNTVEQTILSCLPQLALSTWLDEKNLQLIPILVFLFVFGRITFWIGYLIGGPSKIYRGIGFTMTMFPSLFSMLAVLFFNIKYGFDFNLK